MNDRAYVLKVKLQLFDQVRSGWQISLIDNPGCDECTEHVTDAASQSLKVSSAYFYVTTYRQYRQKESAHFFRKMYEDNKGIL